MTNTIQKFEIIEKTEIRAFFKHLRNDLLVAFHPDDRFSDYVSLETDVPTFTPDEAAVLDATMEACFEWCDRHNEDIYEIAMESK